MERPKVRFSQVDESNLHKNELHTEKLGRVKVKSIVPANFPIKILKSGKKTVVKNKNICNNDQIINDNKKLDEKYALFNINENIDKKAFEHSDSQISTSEVSIEFESRIINQELKTENTKSQNEDYLKDSQKIMNKKNVSEIEPIINKVQTMAINDSANELNKVTQSKNISDLKKKSRRNSSSDINVEYITCNDYKEVTDTKNIQVDNSSNTNHTKKNFEKTKTVTNRKSSLEYKNTQTNYSQLNKNSTVPKSSNKENCAKNAISDKSELSNYTGDNFNSRNHSNKICQNVSGKKFVKTQKKLEMMPLKITSETKGKCINKPTKTQVKKSSVFHVSGNHCSISVIPEVMNKKHLNQDTKKVDEKKKITSKDLLSHPEYNSMISVIKKMKDIKKEKIITDKDLLPQQYKNLISEKVSAALDFSPYETVYKDLVDLSVDDDKFPVRLMRSKDPEPRYKDLMPKLSDFYNPKFSDEYFTAINPSYFNPVNVNALNIFTISNKISTWKACRDYS